VPKLANIRANCGILRISAIKVTRRCCNC
jgi:hypothetical protein